MPIKKSLKKFFVKKMFSPLAKTKQGTYIDSDKKPEPAKFKMKRGLFYGKSYRY